MIQANCKHLYGLSGPYTDTLAAYQHIDPCRISTLAARLERRACRAARRHSSRQIRVRHGASKVSKQSRRFSARPVGALPATPGRPWAISPDLRHRPAPDVPAKAPSCPCPSLPPLVSARPRPPLKAAVKVLPVRALPVLFARVNGRGVVSVPSLFASLSASLFASLFATRRCSAASTAAEPRAHHVARREGGRRVDTACDGSNARRARGGESLTNRVIPRHSRGAWRGTTQRRMAPRVRIASTSGADVRRRRGPPECAAAAPSATRIDLKRAGNRSDV